MIFLLILYVLFLLSKMQEREFFVVGNWFELDREMRSGEHPNLFIENGVL